MKWLKQRLRIAAEIKLLFANIALAGGAYLIVFAYPAPEGIDLRLRVWGMLLQLIGVFTVWYDLTRAARQLGAHGMLGRTWRSLKDLVFGRESLLSGGNMTMGSLTAAGHLRSRHPIKPDADIAERVRTIEKNLDLMDRELTDNFDEIARLSADLKAKILNEASQRQQQVDQVNKDVKDVIVGNYALLLFGVVWLAIGVVLTSVAPEILKLRLGNWAEVVGALLAVTP